MSTPNNSNLLGWKRDDDAVGEFTAKLVARYGAATFGDSVPELRGHWKRLIAQGVVKRLAQDFEFAAIGQNIAADSQNRGTCVSRGTYRAIQDGICYDVCMASTIGRAPRIAFEPIYGGSRVNIGRGQLGSDDGSVGAWAAEFVSTFGVVERARYGDFDLSQPNETRAVEWGQPHHGVPAVVLSAGQQHTVSAHRVMTVDDLADCLASGHFAAYCSNNLWGDRDANGMARPESHGGHCEEIAGVFLRPNGETAFVRQQSWGSLPGGPNTLVTKNGTVILRQGSYGAYADDMQRGLDHGGECWCFKLRNQFRPQSLEAALS